MSTELHDKQGRLVTQARETLDEIKSNTDESRAAELDARHDAIMAEYDKNEQLIERQAKVSAIEARAQKAREEARPDQSGEGRGQDEGQKIEYRAAFLELARSGFDIQEVSPEARSVLKSGIVDLESRAQTVGTNSSGGFTVPTELADSIDKTMKMWGPMYDEAICNVLTTLSGNPIDFPTSDDTGVATAKHVEAAALTDDASADASVAKMTLNAFAYNTKWVQISMELLQDSNVNIEAFIGELLGERLARRVNVELTTGDGTGDPNGIVTASAAGLTAAATGAVTFDELIRLQHSVDPAYRASPKARFMFNDSTLSALRRIKDGDGSYIWQMGDVRTGVAGTLLGQSYSINQAMADMATGAKAIIYGDFGKYYVRKVGVPIVGVRREYYWPNIGLAGVVRLDGDLIQSSAVKHIVQA